MENVATEKLKQPKGLYLISFTAIWERFSYYGMRAILILYMVNSMTADNPKGKLGGLGFSDSTGGNIYGLFTGACYFLPLIGGYLADRYLGKRRSVLIGGIFIMCGHFTLALFPAFLPFILGLTLLAIGNGFFKPNASSMVGDLYAPGDKRRDSAFTIFYMLFNGGAFLAPIICGFLGENYGYRYGFLAAGTGMALGLLVYIFGAQKYLGDIGREPVHKAQKDGKTEMAPLTKQEKDRISVIVVLLFFVTFFWAGFEQAGSTLNLFAERFTDRTFLGWTIPTSFFQAVNPIFILILGPLFSTLWIRLANKNKNPSTPVKMGLGLITLGIAFLFMVGACLQRGANSTDPAMKANLFWLVGFYFMCTIGELFLSPIGLSMVTKLAPLRFASLFMGTWFLSTAIANFLAGKSVGIVEKIGPFNAFLYTAILIGILGFIVLIISRWLLNRMHGAD